MSDETKAKKKKLTRQQVIERAIKKADYPIIIDENTKFDFVPTRFKRLSNIFGGGLARGESDNTSSLRPSRP